MNPFNFLLAESGNHFSEISLAFLNQTLLLFSAFFSSTGKFFWEFLSCKSLVVFDKKTT